MKVIHIAGWSGSGKTTFIVELCSHLKHLGKTATVKHIGSHHSILSPGKDTTLHYNAGAEPAIGIDEEKTCASFHSTSLDDALNLLSDTGVRYAVLEGFKKRPFQKILIGDLDDASLLKNPQIPDVLEVLDQFDDWYTLAGLMKDLGAACDHGHVHSWTGYAPDYLHAVALCAHIEGQYMNVPRISGIRIRVQRWTSDDRYPVYLVLGDSHGNDLTVFSEVLDRISPCILP